MVCYPQNELMKEEIKYVAIAGNIGAGKTTLCTKLGNHFGWEVEYEDATNNPYLSDFYVDMSKWSFHLQIHFLHHRYKQVIEILKGSKPVIQDRTIYEDAGIFAPNLHDMGLLNKRDFVNYTSLFETMADQIKAPDLLIYLRASIPTLVDHIQKRGRDYESKISLDYLKRLNDRYEYWISDYNYGKKLIVETDGMDYEKHPEHFGTIINQVQGELYGLF
jgi:deoxyadenosine/deoxycytidine kinase